MLLFRAWKWKAPTRRGERRSAETQTPHQQARSHKTVAYHLSHRTRWMGVPCTKVRLWLFSVDKLTEQNKFRCQDSVSDQGKTPKHHTIQRRTQCRGGGCPRC